MHTVSLRIARMSLEQRRTYSGANSPLRQRMIQSLEELRLCMRPKLRIEVERGRLLKRRKAWILYQTLPQDVLHANGIEFMKGAKITSHLHTSFFVSVTLLGALSAMVRPVIT